ncbi:hypothetical protein NDU88_002248 [Pleurodeles waltl]|uniref:Uncharacterized protein n=1 Tax=Pleurodeles waltl TaxID=8319 RepID=A0AAV7T212_PLEWA|nr:hypothetical protein NDU88_002248 [Pleurodeles waltl]
MSSIWGGSVSREVPSLAAPLDDIAKTDWEAKSGSPTLTQKREENGRKGEFCSTVGVNGATEREESIRSWDAYSAEPENNLGRQAHDPRMDKETTTARRIPRGT